jgi:hypothetical protein
MYLRVAALYGRDPADPLLAAEYLVLTGVCATEGEARKAVEYVRDTPVPPRRGRLPVKSWYQAVVSVLTLAQFLSPGGSKTRKSGWRARVVQVVQFTVSALVWALTWIVPVTSMIVMAWSTRSTARGFGHKMATHFAHPGDAKAVAAAEAQRKAERRLLGTIVRGALVLVSVVVPLALVASALLHHGLFGVKLPAVLAGLAGLTLVIVVGTFVYMRTS